MRLAWPKFTSRLLVIFWLIAGSVMSSPCLFVTAVLV